jgi:hypothetical protein
MFAACYDDFLSVRFRTPDTQQLGVVACILLLLTSMVGCSKVSVAQEIVNWTPTIESQVEAVLAIAATIMPVDAPIFVLATAGLDGAAKLLTTVAQSYLANPNATTLGAVQDAIAALEGVVNNGLLQAARIVDPKTQKLVLLVFNGIGAAVNAVLSLVETISSKAAIARMALHQRVKLAQVSQLMIQTMMQNAQDRVAKDMGITIHSTPAQFIAQQEAYGF